LVARIKTNRMKGAISKRMEEKKGPGTK
jgi:hypothetical protein